MVFSPGLSPAYCCFFSIQDIGSLKSFCFCQVIHRLVGINLFLPSLGETLHHTKHCPSISQCIGLSKHCSYWMYRVAHLLLELTDQSNMFCYSNKKNQM